jgi:enoyl-CoA hydratase/carnithine racemase
MILTIDRPAAANAIDTSVSDAIVATLAKAAGEPEIAGVVLTATGERVFCAGIDLKNSDNLPPLRLAERRSASLDFVLCAILAFPKPLVVAVNGAAIGAGFMLALLADVAVAAETARFALPEIDHGMPTPIGLALIQDVAGGALATNLVLQGRSMTAAEAERHGLVTCVPAGDLQARATEIAHDLARKPALAFAQNKDWLQRRRRAAIAAATRDSAAYRLRSLQAAEA